MSDLNYYRAQQSFDIDGVTTLFDRAKADIEGFDGFESGNKVMLKVHPESLGALGGLACETIHDLRVEGELPTREDPFPIFRQILKEGREIGRDGQLSVTVGFEEKGSKQGKRLHALVIVSIDRGLRSWFFSSAEAARRDPIYGRDLMYKTAEEPGLPLRFVDEGDDYFRLEHTDGGKLFIQSFRLPIHRNPTAFSCEVSTGTNDDVIDLMSRFVQEFGSSKRFNHSWSVSPHYKDKEPAAASLKILRTIAAAPKIFRARRYILDADVGLEDLTDLETLRAICGPDDRIVTALGYFRPSDVNYVNLEIVTQADGHRLFVDSRLPIDVDELGRTLDVELEDSGHSGGARVDA